MNEIIQEITQPYINKILESKSQEIERLRRKLDYMEIINNTLSEQYRKLQVIFSQNGEISNKYNKIEEIEKNYEELNKKYISLENLFKNITEVKDSGLGINKILEMSEKLKTSKECWQLYEDTYLEMLDRFFKIIQNFGHSPKKLKMFIG